MLVYPAWRAERPALACQRPRWAPEPLFASYVARPHPLALAAHTQIDEEYSSSGCSSPEHGGGGGEATTTDGDAETLAERACACEWRGCAAHVRGVSALSAHVALAHAYAHTDGLFYCGWRACSRPHRGFNARYKMLVHVRTHTNEKPHACAVCDKCFSRAENLKIHMRSHSGEKPYVCPYQGCNKAYSNSSDRFKHTRTHSVDKPYRCKVAGCDKRYTDPSSLRKHVKTYRHYAAPSPPPPAAAAAPPAPPHDAPRVPCAGCAPETDADLYRTHYSVLLRSDAAAATPDREPLDLKCRGGAETDRRGWGLRVHSMEHSMEFQLLRPMEMPLDLSTKS